MAAVINTLRAMSIDDLDEVMLIEQATFDIPWSRTMLEEELKADQRCYLVLEGSAGVFGYGGVMVSDTEGHLMTMAVEPEHRRRGLATRLLSGLLQAALDIGATRLLLEVRPSNTAARHMYQKFGFVPVGIRPRYYRDEDAIVMWVDDADAPEYAALLKELGS